MLARLLQPEKAEGPIKVTESGITTLSRFLQRKKAVSPMEVTELGITTLVRLRRSANNPPVREVAEELGRGEAEKGGGRKTS